MTETNIYLFNDGFTFKAHFLKSLAERANNGIVGKFSKTMECYSDVINDAVKGTEFEEK